MTRIPTSIAGRGSRVARGPRTARTARPTRPTRPTLGALGALVFLGLAGAGCEGGGESGPSEPAPPAALAAALPEGDHVLFADASVRIEEAARLHEATVLRTGRGRGETRVAYRIDGLEAVPGRDVAPLSGILVWGDGDLTPRRIAVRVLSDIESEHDERFALVLEPLSGEDTLGGSGRLDYTLADSDCDGELPLRIERDTSLDRPCYHMTSTLRVEGDAQLLLRPGTTIVADAGTALAVGGAATLWSRGSEARPVTLRGARAEPGSWEGVRLTSSSVLHALERTEIGEAVIGLELTPGSALAAFADNRFARIAGAALRLPLASAASLDRGTRFEDGAAGVALADGRIDPTTPATLAPIATHYLVPTLLTVDGPLVIEPGTELRFALDTQLFVSVRGSLDARGTPDEPIVLRGEESTPGHWRGVHLSHSGSADNRLHHVTIAHGGRDPTRRANLFVDGAGVQLDARHVTLEHGAGFGLRVIGGGDRLRLEAMRYADNALGDEERL